MSVSKPLTILEFGFGLFQTHVTLEDVNLAIREQMKTDSQLTSESQMEVIGDGNGFSSCVILITCDWSIPSSTLPKSMVLKIVSFTHVKDLIEKAEREGIFNISQEDKEKMHAHYETSAQKIHNQEIEFYDILSHGDSEKMLLPKLYFSNKFDGVNTAKGFIGMEYIEGSQTRHTYQNCSIEEIQPILRAIAYVQALTFSSSDESLKKIEDGSAYAHITQQMMSGEGMKGVFMHTKRQDPERFEALVDRVEGMAEKILDFEKMFDLNKFVGIPNNVFVHGDLWAANIIWTTQDGTISVRKVLDYQLCHLGNPAEDLVRCICSVLSGADRREHEQKILEQFYDYFTEAMGDKEVPYSYEQLKQSYRTFFPFGGLALLPLFGPAVDMKLKSADKETAKEYREVVAEKVQCLLEDIEKSHLETV